MARKKEHPLTIYLQTLLAVVLTIPFIFIAGAAIAPMVFLVLVVVLHRDLSYKKSRGHSGADTPVYFADDVPSHHSSYHHPHSDYTDDPSHH